ncbi:hypothetical protein 5325.tmp1 [Eimeria tenella]|uniref:Uncharacterized protein n=1 Tax=Eimeria tenella TaxID=5802 RepID=C8TDY3_EIMTE|nr:hypothetical protein 5325.tmp1 [Eimeria tenella]
MFRTTTLCTCGACVNIQEREEKSYLIQAAHAGELLASQYDASRPLSRPCCCCCSSSKASLTPLLLLLLQRQQGLCLALAAVAAAALKQQQSYVHV